MKKRMSTRLKKIIKKKKIHRSGEWAEKKAIKGHELMKRGITEYK